MSIIKLSRREIAARTKLLNQLKQEHKRVRTAYERFKKLDREAQRAEIEALVSEVIGDLELRATLEEALLCPAARAALDDHDLLDEAEVEHESLHALIGQLQSMPAGDEMYGARFTVLCEYAQHHVKEEEGELFPRLRMAQLDWEDLASRTDARRRELLGSVDVDAAGRHEDAALGISAGRCA